MVKRSEWLVKRRLLADCSEAREKRLDCARADHASKVFGPTCANASRGDAMRGLAIGLAVDTRVPAALSAITSVNVPPRLTFALAGRPGDRSPNEGRCCRARLCADQLQLRMKPKLGRPELLSARFVGMRRAQTTLLRGSSARGLRRRRRDSQRKSKRPTTMQTIAPTPMSIPNTHASMPSPPPASPSPPVSDETCPSIVTIPDG